MPAGRVTTLEEIRHRLVGGTDLHLHEIRALVTARRTNSVGRVYVLPRLAAAKNMIDFLQG